MTPEKNSQIQKGLAAWPCSGLGSGCMPLEGENCEEEKEEEEGEQQMDLVF